MACEATNTNLGARTAVITTTAIWIALIGFFAMVSRGSKLT